MGERAPFLNTAYSAYHHHERPAEDEELTRVGPGTPCGFAPDRILAPRSWLPGFSA